MEALRYVYLFVNPNLTLPTFIYLFLVNGNTLDYRNSNLLFTDEDDLQ